MSACSPLARRNHATLIDLFLLFVGLELVVHFSILHAQGRLDEGDLFGVDAIIRFERDYNVRAVSGCNTAGAQHTSRIIRIGNKLAGWGFGCFRRTSQYRTRINRVSLLDYVGKLVRDQGSALCSPWRILASAKDQVVADGVGARI